MAQLWFVAEVGRGTALVAYVYGPYNSKADYLNANPGFAGASFQTVGNQAGYTSKADAQAEANLLNTGSATTPTQNEPTGPPANENFSPSAITNRTKAAGGTVGTIPGLSYLDFIGKAYAWISNRGNMVRIVKVAAGGGMILVGLNMLITRESSLVNAAETVAKVVK